VEGSGDKALDGFDDKVNEIVFGNPVPKIRPKQHGSGALGIERDQIEKNILTHALQEERTVGLMRAVPSSSHLALTWRKWSLIAAFLAGTIFVIFYLFLRNDSLSEEPIIRPEPPISPSAP